MESSDLNSLKRLYQDLPSRTQLAMGLLAFAVVQLFRPQNVPVLCVVVETIIYIATPLIILAASSTRFKKNWNRNVPFQLVGLVFTLIPLASQFVLRLFGVGDAYEVIAIMSVLNLAWYLTVFSKTAGCRNSAFALTNSVVLFVCFATQEPAVYAAAFGYAVVALWWMLENYWSRLLPKKLDAETNLLPIRGLVFSSSLVLLVVVGVVAAAAGPIRNVIVVAGFMPTSGGEDGYDDMFARSGVGDGDMLTTGENATTVGAVDTDQFIESKKPSIYDVVSEKYDGPVRKRNEMSAAQSLTAIAKHVHNIKQAEQSGRTFRTVRKSKEVYERELEDRISDALFYVEGKIPCRFRVDTFEEFDGWDWTKTPKDEAERYQPAFHVQDHHGIPWFVLDGLQPGFLTLEQHYRVKILRLETGALPAPSFLKAWHIAKVDQQELFKWNDAGLLAIRSDKIPSQTVIDMISHNADLYSLRSVDSQRFQSATDSVLTRIPQNESKTRIQQLARSLTQDVTPGWQQVAAIKNHLKSSFRLSESDVPPEDCADSVGWFLDNGGGPSYLFATTAVQLLRSVGFRTRLATGFVVHPKDYIRKSGQSVVTHENYHVWPEVFIDGRHWVPVEPTPGILDPIGYRTIWHRALVALVDTFRYLRSRPGLVVTFLALITAIICTRRYWIAFLIYCYWRIFSGSSPSRKLRVTRQLIDVRLWLFGVQRPSFVAIRDWFRKIDNDLPNEFFDCWNRVQFCSSELNASQGKRVRKACQDIVANMSLKKIKRFANQQHD